MARYIPPDEMSPEQYVRALHKLGLTVASKATAKTLGVTVRQSLRYASGENAIPGMMIRLLRCLISKR